MRAIFYYGSCKLDGGDSVNATGSLDVNGWTRTDDAVVFEDSELIYNYQSKTGGYVFDAVRTTVHSNGSVYIRESK